MSVAVHVAGVAHRHGDWVDVAELSAGGVADKTIANLRAGGVTRFSRIDGSPKRYYADCVGETLRRTGIDAADVDALIFVSSTFAPDDDYDDVAELCAELGMRPEFPLGTFLGQCTNFSTALRVATSLIRGDGIDNVLLLGSDALNEDRASRVLPREASVFSDTVASWLVTRAPIGYAVDGVAHVFEPDLHRLHPEKDVLKLVERFSGALARACKSALEDGRCGPEDITRLVLPNLTRPVLRNYAAVSGVPAHAAFTDNVGEFGHCFAYDQLIALDALAEDESTHGGQRVLTVGVGGNHLFSACCLRKV